MRVLLIMLALCGTAYAAPDDVAAEDWSALELAQAHVETAAAQMDAMRSKLALKYRLDDGDAVDPKTRHIVRAARPKKP